MSLERLRDRIGDLDRVLAVEVARLRDRRTEAERLAAEVEDLRSEEALLARVDAVLLQVSGKVLGQSTDKVDRLLEAGLNLVFDDQQVEFHTEIDRMRGKTSARFRLKVGGVEAPPMDAFGGGVLVVAGVLLRVVTIMVLGLERELLLDESLSHLSQQYVPNASRLLKKLSRELGFRILAVTHDPELAAHADRHYEARQRRGATEFHLVAGEK